MSLVKRTKTALDESRMLMLGAEILLGFQFHAPFQNAFDRLSSTEKAISLFATALMVLVIGLLIAPSARHRVVENGRATSGICHFISQVALVTLFPFALALALDCAIAFNQIGGLPLALIGTPLTGLAALTLWYGPLFRSKRRSTPMSETEEHSSTEQKIEFVLTECRVILPGAQALLGFQLIIVMTTGFQEMPAGAKAVHAAALVLVALATILLIAPAAFHRIVYDGATAAEVHIVAGRLILAATMALALGISADAYVVAIKITGDPVTSSLLAICFCALLVGLWHVWPLLARKAQRRSGG